MSYTINPNAKNKWARNAENTMDLSLETDASSVYLDNGRTLEQEIGEGSMVSNVATVDSAMSKIIDGTLDGAYESLVFKGKSLVNIVNYSNGDITSGNSVDLTTGTITLKGRNGWSNAFLKYQQMKPSTKYLCWVNILQVTGTVDYLQVISSSNQASAFTNAWRVESPSVGFYKNIMTSETDLTDRKYVFRSYVGSGSNGATIQYQVGCVEYQEGMENWDIPCFTGIGSVKMPILRNVGKNLFNPSLLLESETRFGITKNVVGETIVLNGTSSQYHDLHFTPNDNKTGIVVKKGKSYKLTIHCLGGTSTPVLNPAVKLTLKDGTIKWLGSNIDLRDSNCDGLLTWFRICPQEGNSFSNYQIKLQLEESSTSTSYESYKTNILHTSEEIVLREVNGIQDTYNPLTGEYVRRIGEVVLDGSENWSQIALTNKDDYLAFGTPLLPKGITTKYNTNNIIDSHGFSKLQLDYADNGSHLGEAIIIHNNGNLYFRMLKTRLSTADKDGWLSYLQLSPITVQYKLAEPITTIVESLTTPFAYQNGHVILESGHEGQSLLPTLEYSTVINKTGLIENVAKTIQRQEKQLTMLEKMLIQNIINLDYNNTLLTLKNEMEEML